jgi:hypothetical protein
MTPFELALRNELHVEWQRFSNDWLFPWHNINIEGRVVEVEDFRGGRFHTGGIVFQGQIQTMFWQSIGRYLSAKIHNIFQNWDEKTRTYPTALRKSSLTGTEQLLRQFVSSIISLATDTDRALRGQGYPDRIDPFNSTGYHSDANAEIHRLVEAHMALLPMEEPKKEQSWFDWWEAVNIRPGMFGIGVDLKKLFRRRK